MPRTTVSDRPVTRPLRSPCSSAWWAQVTVVPDSSSVMVLNSGRCSGSRTSMPTGGHWPPRTSERAAWIASFGKQAGVEEGPEPRDEEHHLGGDEHDHAVTQMHRDHRSVVAALALLDCVRPPGEHGVEHDHEAEGEDPRTAEVEAEQREIIARMRAHPGDEAEHHDERAQRAERRPRARIDDMVVVMLGMRCVRGVRVCHGVFPEPVFHARRPR